MTTEQFRDCFLGEKGYDSLRKLMKSGNEICTEFAKCWQDRYEVENAYAKGLRKSSEAFQKLAGRSKGSMIQAFTTIAAQTNIESEAHNLFANTLLNKISGPMKNLADTQSKARKPIEDTLNGKFKIWKDKKENDNKYRQRQFDNCKEIENLYLKMDEIPKTTKNSVKDVGKEVQLVTACVFPGGRNMNTCEKSTASPSFKHTSNIEMSLRKLEQELDKTEKKYHDATKEVELSRQSCDAEMCRSCDQMQTMELDRINELDKFIQTYTSAIQTLCDTMEHVKQELYSIQITALDDISAEAKLNVQTTETEILVYDIYAENEHNAMSQERRVLSLMHWMQMLRQDIDIQRRSKDDYSPLSSSSDGASPSHADIVLNRYHDGSSCSSNDDDDDGAMHRHNKKGENKKLEGIENLQGFCKQNQNFSTSVNSSAITINRESVRLLQCLYEGSLYKMERMYNHLKHLPEPQYEHSQRFAKSYNDKGIPTTFLRVPFQPVVYPNPPSAPSTTSTLARSTPILGQRMMMQQPVAPAPPPPYSAHPQSTIGWVIPNHSNEHAADTRSSAPTPPYPILPNAMTASTDSLRSQHSDRRVKVLHGYEAQHDDELTIRPGDIITLLERRADQWCKGSLYGNVGLFPGNFVQDI